ncbi:PAS domain-containing protein [Dyadobacter sp. CY107]|uniref:sensor histidine kinase n=1 Tax=Dyadobacter fanqingshengii TaxID=2906443 RepID=UPI001F3F8371|nr:PAS domain-containing protein [Dyadobacter fanqingshengii]MCF2502052.1 PAS domain-containing protein [Dyadobacter fanqingshengii]
MLLFGLRQHGYLFLGSSENPLPILQSLKVVSKKFKVYKNLDATRVVRFDSFSLPEVSYKKPADLPNLPQQTAKVPDRTLGDAVNETLMRDLGQLVICIDQNEKILKFYGDTTKFLLQKIMATDFVELLPGPLAVAYKAVIGTVVQNDEASTVAGIRIRQGEQTVNVTLSVSPMIYKGRSNGFLVVRISEESLIGTPASEGQVYDEEMYLNQYTQSLEDEVRDLKEKLTASSERLYSLDENMQSFNEELLSANEEMQSTTEEMQSINEELHTINADYQIKNKELLELNDDLNNYFRSNVNGQLFVDDQLRLVKFSPGTVKLINLLESDVGRPLSDISTNFKLETITEDITQILAGNPVITKEIQTNNGRWYQVMTMPYIKQIHNKTSGAVITFNDITDLRTTQQKLDKKNQALVRINEDLDNFVHSASHDLLGPLNSIEGSISLMNAIDTSDQQIKEVLPIITGSIKKFRLLVKEIAQVAKIESDATETEPVDVDELLDDIEWSLTEQINSSGAIIKRDVQVKQVLFSKKNLRSILYNLTSNSIKYRSEKPPLIVVRIAAEGNHTILSVQDNGMGIEKRHLDTIFNKYARLQTDGEGYGIGLYLTSKIVNASGGRITVESEPGNGSKFMISLNK